jgi:hypothetical protein
MTHQASPDSTQDERTAANVSQPEPARPLACTNCGTVTVGPFCHSCGQRAVQASSLRAFLSDALTDLFNLRSRSIRSLIQLVIRPGVLTAAWVGGRRVRYTQPVQLYLIGAAVFFLANSYQPFIRITEDNNIVSALSGGSTAQDISPERLERLAARGISNDVFRERFQNIVSQSLPQFMVGSILLFTAALWLFSPRRPALTHAVFALHWTAFFLFIMSIERLTSVTGGAADAIAKTLASFALLHLLLSLRRVYGFGWPRAALSAFGLMLVFNVIMVGWVLAVVAYAFWQL